jgi:hypothetical protein
MDLTKNFIKTFLKHYIGPYLKNELCIEQIQAQYGKVEVHDLDLDPEVSAD